MDRIQDEGLGYRTITIINQQPASPVMRIPKRYGQSRIDNCPFCGNISVTKNKQGVPVCQKHKHETLDGLRCVCGELLDLNEGKWGPYFRCMSCGNISFRKGIELNPQIREKDKAEENKDKKDNPGVFKKTGHNDPKRKEITVTSDQLDFLY
ncbi:hypothetical protein KY358_00730 [Candidatus Woesearchaeota archaeon]|nr:hypothetical protein [Candidatus Woesearchaeota archaeon]